MLEILFVTAVISFGVSAVSHAVRGSVRLERQEEETELATRRALAVVEELRSARFRDVFSLYNGDPVDDPGGQGSAPGARFTVPGLEPLPSNGDGAVGRILFPSVQSELGREELREDVVCGDLGTPRDLSGDGVVDSLCHCDDYLLLPVQVRVEWMGPAGPASVQFQTVIGEPVR